MKIIISNEQPVSLIREQFNRLFPYLKIEFFSALHVPGQTSALKDRQPRDRKIGELRELKSTGEMTIRPDMTVQELEQQFAGKYGLGVQVLRRFGNTWLETARTDSWTLSRQNEQGRSDCLLTETTHRT